MRLPRCTFAGAGVAVLCAAVIAAPATADDFWPPDRVYPHDKPLTLSPSLDEHDHGHTAPVASAAARKRLPSCRSPWDKKRKARSSRRRAKRCGTEASKVGAGPRNRKEAGVVALGGGGADQYLPWANGQGRSVWQGNGGSFSHNAATTRYGWDFGLGYGEAVHAAAGGEVFAAQGGCNGRSSPGCNGGWGNWVAVRVADGTCSRYAHLARIDVARGQRIGRYHVVGAAGNSGFSTATHLHYQREWCVTHTGPRSIGSAFADAGNPRGGTRAVSRNAPDAPPVPPFTASLDAQFPSDAAGNATLRPGQNVEFGFNVRFNQPYDTRFVLRPTTGENVGRFSSMKGDWPGVRPANDGAVGYFRARLSVPVGTAPGRYFVQWDVVNAATGQVAGLQPSFSVNVPAPRDYPAPKQNVPFAASFVDQSWPRIVGIGQTADVRFRLRNDGRQGWDSAVRLASEGDRAVLFGAGGLSGNANRVAFTDEDGDGFAAPGEIATFSYQIRPDRASAHRQFWHVVRDGPGPHFGSEIGMHMLVLAADKDHFPPELGAGDCTWGYVGQTGSPLNAKGEVLVNTTQTSRYSFTIRNTSAMCPWFPDGVAPVRLATRRSTDRGSGFAVADDGWIGNSNNRVRLPNVVLPSETVTIPFGLRAAGWAGKGLHKEHMAPVVEGKFHLDDSIGMYAPVLNE